MNLLTRQAGSDLLGGMVAPLATQSRAADRSNTCRSPFFVDWSRRDRSNAIRQQKKSPGLLSEALQTALDSLHGGVCRQQQHYNAIAYIWQEVATYADLHSCGKKRATQMRRSHDGVYAAPGRHSRCWHYNRRRLSRICTGSATCKPSRIDLGIWILDARCPQVIASRRAEPAR